MKIIKAKKITKKEGQIDWNSDALKIIGKIKIPIRTNKPGNKKTYLCLKFMNF